MLKSNYSLPLLVAGMWLRQTAAGSRFSLLQYLSLSLLLSPCILPYPTFFLVHLSSCPLFYLSLSPLSLSHRCHITPHTCTFPLSLSLSHLPAFSLAPPACRRLPVHLPRQSNNWLLSVLESSRKSGRRRRSRGGKGEEEELFCEASFAHPSLAAAAAASVPLPPSAAAQRPPLSLLDAPSPAGICLHLLLRELFLELGGGGRSPPPSLPRTLSEARRIVGELRRGTTLSDRRKQGKRPEWHTQSSHFHTLLSPFAHPVKRRKKTWLLHHLHQPALLSALIIFTRLWAL